MDYKQINKNAVKSWFIGRIIFTIVFLLIYGVIIYKFVMPNLTPGGMVSYILNGLTMIIAGFLLLNTFLFPIIEYKEWRYKIEKDKIELLYGIIFRKKIIIPISRIQYIDIESGPIYRKFNLAELKINTAGSSHEIPALTLSEANDISENLKEIIEKSGKIE